MRRAVFLDRDGVINRAILRDNKPYPPSNLDELEILPGVMEALALLHAADFLLIVTTNQPDVARGKVPLSFVENIHTLLAAELPIDDFQVCYHDNVDNCSCRKPAPGMLLSAARAQSISLTNSYMVGDRWRDIEAGRQAGCKTLLIDYHYSEELKSEPDNKCSSLLEAAHWILSDIER
jgi:D-glycero-D-manno-heptose 1,7-bisphosphate phosphatase